MMGEKYSVTFDGQELSNYIDVDQSFTPYLGADWSPSVHSFDGIQNGAEFQFQKFSAKTIQMPFFMIHGLSEKYDALERILNVSEPKRLIFQSQPDRYYLAIPNGTLDFEQILKTGTGTIEWYVPDGLAHAREEKTFTATMQNGILTADVYNAGVDDVPVSYEITNNHENGFIGIVSQYGAIQLGNIQEVDKTTGEMSQELFRFDTPAELNGMTNNQGILTEDFPMNGSWGTTTAEGDQWIYLANQGSGPTWHGASKYQVVPAINPGGDDAENFYAQTKVWFETGRVNQTGLAEFVIGDSDGNHLASIHLLKAATNSNIAQCVFQVQNKEVGRVSFEPSNKGPSTKDGGQLYIKKSGEVFEFYFAGTYTYRVPEAAAKKAHSVTLFLGNYSSGNELITRLYFKYVFFIKNNVQYEVDVPNRYPSGSVININGESGKVTVDGVASQGDEVIGSQYFTVPPGRTRIEFYYSSFSDPPPSIVAKIREAYL